MISYKIMRLSCSGAFRWFFCAGICFGGLIGIILGLLDRSITGIFSGMFFGFVFGVLSGLFGVTYAAVFNILSPFTGGIAVQLEPAAKSPISDRPSADQPDAT